MDADLIGETTEPRVIVKGKDDAFWRLPVVYEYYVDGELVGTLSMTVDAIGRFMSHHKNIQFFGRSIETLRLQDQERVDALEAWRSLPWWRRLFSTKP